MTAWSEHARHYILTSNFDAALTSETHLGRDKLVIAVTEARKSSWAGTGCAAITTANNGTSAGVLALVRTRWSSKPLSTRTDEAGVLCTNPRLGGKGHSSRGQGDVAAHSVFRALCRFPLPYQCQFDARRLFSHERWETSHAPSERTSISHPACGRTCLFMEADSGSKCWEHRWSLQRVPDTRAVQAGVKKPDIVDIFPAVKTHSTSDTKKVKL